MGTTTSTRGPVRGGISFIAVLTGVIVAFGAIFLLSALLGGLLTAAGVDASEVEPTGIGMGLGVAFVVVQFLAFLWGGYTAGRMARGAGMFNGLLVPVGALLLGALVWAATAALGAAANLNLPFTTGRLPVEESYLIEWGQVIGLVALAALILGGMAGGLLGARWHTRLEADAAPVSHAPVAESRPADDAPVAESRPVDEGRTITLDERERAEAEAAEHPSGTVPPTHPPPRTP